VYTASETSITPSSLESPGVEVPGVGQRAPVGVARGGTVKVDHRPSGLEASTLYGPPASATGQDMGQASPIPSRSVSRWPGFETCGQFRGGSLALGRVV